MRLIGETTGYLRVEGLSSSLKDVLKSVWSLSPALHKAKQSLARPIMSHSRCTQPESAEHLYLNQTPCGCGRSCLRLCTLEYLSDTNFFPPVQTRSYCSTGSALLVCRALAEFIKRPRIKSQLERQSRSLVGYTGSPCDVCSVNSAHHSASPWIKGEQ